MSDAAQSLKVGFQCDYLDTKSDDGRNVRLLTSFQFIAEDGAVITVPAGATADGASTPRALWRVLPPFGNYWMSAVLHDWLYRQSDLPKERCDALFLEAMLDDGVVPWKARLIYAGVKWFGRAAFDENRARRAAQESLP